jgi:hypothetical protein
MLRSHALCVKCKRDSEKSRCDGCGKRESNRAKELLSRSSERRLKYNKQHRDYHAMRTEELAMCSKHPCELPCVRCAEYKRDHWRKNPVRKLGIRRKCSRCDSYDHGTRSSLCPKRFAVFLSEYAQARTGEATMPALPDL